MHSPRALISLNWDPESEGLGAQVTGPPGRMPPMADSVRTGGMDREDPKDPEDEEFIKMRGGPISGEPSLRLDS